MSQTYLQMLHTLLPETTLVGTALLVLLLDVSVLKRRPLAQRFAAAAGLGTASCLVAMVLLLAGPSGAVLGNGLFLRTPLSVSIGVGVLALTALSLLLTAESAFTEDVGEYTLLVLLAATGGLLLIGTRDLLVFFIALELLSLSLYLLTGFDKARPESAQAALKYFLFGGMSAAFLLYGYSLLYGLAHSTSFAVIATAVQSAPGSGFVAIALLTTIIGLGFKVAAVPFHFWVPDTYQGAPAPAAGFIASVSKLASFYAFFLLTGLVFLPVAGRTDAFGGWTTVLAGMAALSMLVGNLAALAQTSFRRLLAYSAIAHAGYMLIALVSHTPQSLNALLYYLITYGLATLGTFAIAAVVERSEGTDAIHAFDGLSQRAPLLSACLLVFLLSQAGIPPLAGFFGKFFLFIAAVNSPGGSQGLLWLVVLAVAASAVSLYYYLQVLKRVYVSAPVDTPHRQTPPFTLAVIGLLAALTLLLGCAPQLLVGWIAEAVRQSGAL